MAKIKTYCIQIGCYIKEEDSAIEGMLAHMSDCKPLELDKVKGEVRCGCGKFSIAASAIAALIGEPLDKGNFFIRID